MLGYDDKRNFYRMMVNSPCLVMVVGSPTQQSMNAVCRDISATGLSIELQAQQIELGSLLEVIIESSNEELASLVAKAKVIRCDPLSDEACLVGAEISEMN
jgi:hypothetical protein